MKDVKFTLAILLLSLLLTKAYAQNLPEAVNITPGKTYVFIKNDGAQYLGKVLNQDEKDIMINAKKAGIIVLHKSEIKGPFEVTKREQSPPQPAGQARKRHFYLKSGIGFALVQSGQTGGSSQTTSVNSMSSTRFNYKPYSLSSGINGALGAGFMFSDHIGVELYATIGISNKQYSFSGSYYDNSSGYSSYSDLYSTTVHAKTTILLIPAITIQTGGNPNAYARLGIVLPVCNKIIAEEESANPTGLTDRTVEYKNRFTLGYNAAAGMSFKVSSRVRLWCEINLLSFSPYLKEGEVTKSSRNGVDDLSTLTAQQKKVEFQFSGTSNYNTSYQNSPDTRQTYSTPYGNIGLMAGISFQL